MMVIGRTHDEATAALDAFIANHGWPPEVVELMAPHLTLGGPDEIGEAITELRAAGLDGVTLNLCANAHDPEMITLAGEVADKALG